MARAWGVPLPLLLLLLTAAAQLCAVSASRELGVGVPGPDIAALQAALRLPELPAKSSRRLQQSISLNSRASQCVWEDNECNLSPAYLFKLTDLPYTDLQK
jgi:hypothetical protein